MISGLVKYPPGGVLIQPRLSSDPKVGYRDGCLSIEVVAAPRCDVHSLMSPSRRNSIKGECVYVERERDKTNTYAHTYIYI